MKQGMIYIINGGRGYACVYLIPFYCVTQRVRSPASRTMTIQWEPPTLSISLLTLILK